MEGKTSKYLYLLLIPSAWVFFASIRSAYKEKAPKKLPSKGRSVLIIGDSHTGPSNTWTADFIKEAQFSSSSKIAENGKTTSWMLAQLKAYLDKNKKPDYIVVWGGANDAYNGIAQATTIANMQAMINIAKAKGSDIIFLSGYDAKKVSYNFVTAGLLGNETTLRQGRDRWVALLEAMPEKLKGYSMIVPPHPTFTRLNSSDGLHLYMSSYRDYGKWLANNYFID
jgi:lysophospholipase L1-like esterase